MKKLLCFVLTIVFCCHTNCYALELSASSAVVVELETGAVVYAKDEDTRRTMASTTKIMTAICALEEGDLSKKVKIPPQAVGIEGSSIYLREGEELTLKELVYGLMLNSGNDAAVAIAYAVAGSVEDFAELMNTKAKEIGAKNTHFMNPNGLDEDGHYTTAKDLAVIAAYAMKNKDFKEIASTYQTTITGSEEGTKRYLTNHNKLLKRMEGCIGVKTGFTKKSGRCLVSATERDEITLVAVTLNAPDDWNDHINMMNYSFERVERKKMVSKGELLQEVKVEDGDKKTAKVICSDDFYASMLKDRPYVAKYRFSKSIKAPIKKGTEVGRVEIYMGSSLIATVPAVAGENVGVDKTRCFGKSLKSIIDGWCK